jgi:hypothetical protein
MSLVVLTLVNFLHVVYSSNRVQSSFANNIYIYIHTEFDLPEVWLEPKKDDYQLSEESQSQTTKEFVSLLQVPVCAEISLTIGVANEGTFFDATYEASDRETQ